MDSIARNMVTELNPPLKPCPFCGSLNLKTTTTTMGHGNLTCCIQCYRCGCCGPDDMTAAYNNTKMSIEELWNERL